MEEEPREMGKTRREDFRGSMRAIFGTDSLVVNGAPMKSVELMESHPRFCVMVCVLMVVASIYDKESRKIFPREGPLILSLKVGSQLEPREPTPKVSK